MKNIGGDQSDVAYRYRRNELQITYIKNRTQLDNIELIAKQLHCLVKDITDYFRKKLCTCVKGNMLNGIFQVDDLEMHLDKFIEKYILCPVCHLPELNNKKQCNACGAYFSNN
jgi:translation initiation factor 2 beta subunit (eIF-2beta)/eIF-5